MSKTHKRTSLVVKFTWKSMIITGATALALSIVFVLNARIIIRDQAIYSTGESIGALRNELLARFADWNSLITLTAISAVPFIEPAGVNAAALQRLMQRNMATQPDVYDLWVTSTTRWFEPGGFAIFGIAWSPPTTWDNTDRPWFMAARNNPGTVGYTDPYISASTGNLAIAMAKNIYDDAGADIGIVSAVIDFEIFNRLIEEKTSIGGQRIFLINRQGVFVTHPDAGAVLERDFFREFGLEGYRQSVLAQPSFSAMGRNTFILSQHIPEMDWILVSTVPTSAIFSAVNAFTRNMTLVAVALLAAAMFVSMWFTRKELAVPISGIKSAAGSLAEMDFAVSIEVTKNDEIGDVQGAMQKIRDNLKKSLGEMQGSLESQKKMEVALRGRMQAILDSTPMLCVVYDENGNALEVNREAEAMFGISDKNIFASRFSDFLPPRQPDGTDSMQKNVEIMRQTLRDGHYRYEWMYQRRDGAPLPTEEIMSRIELDGETRIIAFSRDLRNSHARRASEQAAQKKVSEMTERLNGQLEAQSTAISQSSSAIEELIANIKSVSATLSKNAGNVKELQEASEIGHSGINSVAADIKAIAQESEALLQINSVMQNIASQTNLLSMNAAIEAAHAGESGLGFAVVAGEIRKLAESSSQQSKTIRAVLKKIKTAIDKITLSTENVLTKFDAIDGGVKTVAEQENGILNAMAEQGAGSAQIMQAIAQVNEITGQVKEDARQMVEAAAKLGV